MSADSSICPVRFDRGPAGENRPTVDLDHHSEIYAQSWREVLGELSSTCPVVYSTEHGGFWLVTGYDEVGQVAKDDNTYASGNDVTGDGTGYGGIAIPTPPFRSAPIELDGDEFTATRKLLIPAFSPNRMKEWEPYIRESAHQHIDRVIESGSFDVVYDFCAPVPSQFTLRFLGLEPEDWNIYALPAHEFMAPPGSAQNISGIVGMTRMLTLLNEQLELRKQEPRDDYMTYLTQCTIGGEPLSQERLLEICFLVILGGVDTTTSLFACGVDWLSRHPEERDRLANDHSLIPAAIEEFLRYFSTVQGNARTVTERTELAGQTFEAGDRVLISWAGANFDPVVFENPHDVDLSRFPNRHMAFGVGAHRCLGSHAGRLELKIMFEVLLERIPDFVVDQAAAVPYESVGITNGFMSMLATFAPGSRRATGTPAPGSEINA